MKYFILSAFLFLSVLLRADDYSSSSIVKEGDTIPSFDFTLVNENVIKSSELKGKVVLISFFATWCGPCMQELPHLQQEVWDKYKDRGDFKMFVVGREHSKEELVSFIQKKGFSMPFVADPKREVYGAFAKQYIPRLYLIDRNGVVVKMSIGFDENEFAETLKKVEVLLQKN
jgi:peroxiredoxin